MLNSVKDSFRQYATFYGRANRRSYLEVVFFNVLLGFLTVAILVLCLIGMGTSAQESKTGSGFDSSALLVTGFWGLFFIAVSLIYTLFTIATIVPSLAIQSRRLHDANFSAWWLLLHLAPFGGIALFIMNCFNSYQGESSYDNEGKPRRAGRPLARSSANETLSSDEW